MSRQIPSSFLNPSQSHESTNPILPLHTEPASYNSSTPSPSTPQTSSNSPTTPRRPSAPTPTTPRRTASSNNTPSANRRGSTAAPATPAADGTYPSTRRARGVTIVPPATTAALDDLRTAHPSYPPDRYTPTYPTQRSVRSPGAGSGAEGAPQSPAENPAAGGTASGFGAGGGSGSMQRRRRAHTVSVSMPSSPAYNTTGRSTLPRRKGTAEGDLELGLRGRGRAETTATAGTVGSQSSGRRMSTSVSNGGGGSAVQRARRGSSPVGFDIGSDNHELEDDLVGVLDVIDPHVSTVNHLQNMCNSVLIPYLPQLWSRRPEVTLAEHDSDESIALLQDNYKYNTPPSTRLRSGTTRSRRDSLTARFRRGSTPDVEPEGTGAASPGRVGAEGREGEGREPEGSWGGAHPVMIPEEPVAEAAEERESRGAGDGVNGKVDARQTPTYPTHPLAPTYSTDKPSSSSSPCPSPTPSLTRARSASSVNSAQLDADIHDIRRSHRLDRHVQRILSADKREKLKRGLQGLWTFLKTPMGVITAIYGFLVVFWGAAIVLFLLGWIPTNSKNTQDVWVEISSQVVNGLFTVTGVGLIPWRAMDTYRMGVIWTLKRRVERRRIAQGLPPIEDENDLPDPELVPDYVHVLDEKETAKLRHNQEEFAKSQTWYKAHATATHRAFPIKWALWNTILMDLNSFFQCLLCGCMWGMNRHKRPAWTTGSLIPLSFLCGIGAAILIWQGGVRTKKHQAVSDKLREALGVQVAVGLPRAKDGGVVVHGKGGSLGGIVPGDAKEKAGAAGAGKGVRKGEQVPMTAPLKPHVSPEKDPNPIPVSQRRSTVTFGGVPDPMGFESSTAEDGGEGEAEGVNGEKTGRGRGTTVAAPEAVMPLGPVLGEGDAGIAGEK
ncbi:hypothetical protein IAT38_001633 [Cryptococcus sp. DSM 104549]